MKAEIACRGSVVAGGRRIAWRSQFEGDSYNDGAVLCFTWAGEKKRLKIDTYTAQDQMACSQKVEYWVNVGRM